MSDERIRHQVLNQVWNRVERQIRDQVVSQVGNQVRRQVCNQVWDQVENQVGRVESRGWNQAKEDIDEQ